MRKTRVVYRILVEKPEGRRTLGRSRRIWEEKLKQIFDKWNGDMDWLNLARDRDRWLAILYAVMNLRVLEKAENFLTSRGLVSFPGRPLLREVSNSVSFPIRLV
jgi:hypothetical protein